MFGFIYGPRVQLEIYMNTLPWFWSIT